MGLIRVLTRKKLAKEGEEPTKIGSSLKRELSLFDLTLLGVGTTLGVGLYVLAGHVALYDSGPGVVVAFLVAAAASNFAGMCYAEFASKVPKAGSAYVYSYVTVGELTAFIIGWNLVLEYVIGLASVARACSNFVDTLIDHRIKAMMLKWMPINISFLSPYPDFFSFSIIMVMTAMLAWGVKESAILINVLTILNLATISTVIIAGATKADLKNWNINKDDIPNSVKHAGSGGFLPFGISGVMTGAAKCFYGFVGFDSIAASGEEAKNPVRNLPIAILLTLFICLIAYIGISSTLTLVLPYYLQDSSAGSLAHVFREVDMPMIAQIVTVGSMFALTTSMLGGMYPLPRILYAMASDGLLFTSFARINAYTRTPLLGTIVSGVLTGTLSAIFDLDQLVDMLSIGTLLAYTIVALSVLILRYRQVIAGPMLEAMVTKVEGGQSCSQRFAHMLQAKHATEDTEMVAKYALAAFIVIQALLCLALVVTEEELEELGSTWAIGLNSTIGCVMLLAMLVMGIQPQSQSPEKHFKVVPFVPLIPCASIFLNTYLMMKLDFHTWIRFSIWIFLGMLIYIFYSIGHSLEGIRDEMARSI